MRNGIAHVLLMEYRVILPPLSIFSIRYNVVLEIFRDILEKNKFILQHF